MAKFIHRAFVGLLLFVGLATALVISLEGFSYYATALEDRPFHPQYDLLKPSGTLSHGYGIIGTLMITVGVIMYSMRKRVRVFATLGKLKYFLEFHIFLCLFGPLLVLYHTTFKFGGLVAVSFWSMTAVVLSGLIGRYLYVQIPKGIQGDELSLAALSEENKKLENLLHTTYHLDPSFIQSLDIIATRGRSPVDMSVLNVLNFFILNDITRRSRLKAAFAQLERKGLGRHVSHQLRVIANRRVILTRRMAFLQQIRRLFYYWHVVHFPFSIIMFVILLVHVGVAVAFGYTWIWQP